MIVLFGHHDCISGRILTHVGCYNLNLGFYDWLDFSSANCQFIQQHGRLANADRYALAVFPAGADTWIKSHIIADH